MRAVAVALVLAAFAALAAAQQADTRFQQFQQFTHKYSKVYESVEEYLTRYSNFLASLERINNKRQAFFERNGKEADENVFAVTKFSDMSPEEFKKLLGYRPSGQRRASAVEVPEVRADELPSSWDWRSKGAVTPVKNQGQCGSCWAFSTTEEIESMWFMNGGQLTPLSVQQIVSCDTVDQGCNGGDTTTAYDYVKGAGGLETGADYPYRSMSGRNGVCMVDKTKFVVTVSNYTYATPPCQDSCNHQNEDLMQQNMYSTGPVSICLDAETWNDYGGGVLTDFCPHAYDDMDHCVQLVGYDTSGQVPYWIVRNSWGTDWGEAGYIYIEMGKNLCGIANEATFVHAESVGTEADA
jgi:C1A family cysteine protease